MEFLDQIFFNAAIKSGVWIRSGFGFSKDIGFSKMLGSGFSKIRIKTMLFLLKPIRYRNSIAFEKQFNLVLQVCAQCFVGCQTFDTFYSYISTLLPDKREIKYYLVHEKGNCIKNRATLWTTTLVSKVIRIRVCKVPILCRQQGQKVNFAN